MKLKAKIGDLLEAVTQVSATLDRKGEVSGKMHIRASNKGCLYLYSTNMTAETLTKIPAEVEEEGQVLVDHHKIQDGLNGLNREAEVLLSLTPSGGTLKGQSGKTKFSAPASAEVAEMASRIKALPFSEVSTSKIPAGTLAEFLRRGMFCIPLDKTGQYASLAGMKISDNGSGYEAMASDNAIACRIHVETKETGLGKGIVIPYASLVPLNSLLNRKRGEDAEVILPKSGNKIFFKFGDTFYGTLILATTFPNIRAIIDRGEAKYNFEINREALKGSLSRASSFIGLKRTIEIELKDNEFLIKAKGDSSGSEYADTISVAPKGFTKLDETVKMAVVIDYLKNVTDATHSSVLNMGMTNENQPLILSDSEGEDEHKVETKYVLMGLQMRK